LTDVRPDTSAYVLSRIYAQGWSAGKKLLPSDSADISSAGAARNPYVTPVEQSRWMKGFTDSFDSRAVTFTPPGRTTRHNLAAKPKVEIS